MGKKGLIYFSLLKYLEVAITSLSTFIVAKKIGPHHMGNAMPILLYITYSNYLSLGVNQAVIKNHGLYTETESLSIFLRTNLLIVLFACMLSFLLSFVLLDREYSFLAAIISSGVLIRSYYMTIFRITNKLYVLNKNNLVFVTLLLLGILFYTKTLEQYLLCWAVSISVAVGLYYYDNLKNIGYRPVFLLKGLNFPVLSNNITQGIKVGLIGFVATFLMSLDRFFIKDLGLSDSLKGSYQLAEYFGMAFYIFITTILFYYYPKKIKLLRESHEFRSKYLIYIRYSLYVIPALITIIMGLSTLVEKYIFPEYQMLSFLIPLNVSIKAAILFLTALSSLYLVQDREVQYVKSLVLVGGLIVLGNYLATSFLKINYVIFLIPIQTSILIFIIGILKLLKFEKQEKNSIRL